MSLLSQAYLLENFGLRLTIDDMAKVLHLASSTIYNQIAKKTFQIPTYVDGAKRFADFRDVATYLDLCRERAGTPA